MSWVKHTTILKGNSVSLIPLEEKHFEDLNALAEEKRIFEYIPADMSDRKKRFEYFYKALEEKEKGTQVPFVIIHATKNKIIGSTRLMDIHPEHKKLEIGWTWLHPDYWASEINLECKLLLLRFCLEDLKAIRVQLKTDENNIRSRKAIQKIGGTFEGILREDYIRDNGTVRNSVFFSILASEWPEKKFKLEKLLLDKKILNKSKMEKFKYRKGTVPDVKQLAALGLASYGQFKNVLGEEGWKKMAAGCGNETTYSDLLKIAQCFVCENNSKIIGMAFLIPSGNPFAFFEADWAYIRLVGVLGEYEGKGIGKKLTEACIDFAKTAGEKILALHTSEFQDAARHIYESLGFKRLKELDPIYDKRYFLYTLDLNFLTQRFLC